MVSFEKWMLVEHYFLTLADLLFCPVREHVDKGFENVLCGKVGNL